jgi:hypothetical protein
MGSVTPQFARKIGADYSTTNGAEGVKNSSSGSIPGKAGEADGRDDPTGENPGSEPEKAGGQTALSSLVAAHAAGLGGTRLQEPGDGNRLG